MGEEDSADKLRQRERERQEMDGGLRGRERIKRNIVRKKRRVGMVLDT